MAAAWRHPRQNRKYNILRWWVLVCVSSEVIAATLRPINTIRYLHIFLFKTQFFVIIVKEIVYVLLNALTPAQGHMLIHIY